jgi:hypothetical protein
VEDPAVELSISGVWIAFRILSSSFAIALRTSSPAVLMQQLDVALTFAWRRTAHIGGVPRGYAAGSDLNVNPIRN